MDMKQRISAIICLSMVLSGAALVLAQETKPTGQWTSLFNGKDLDGWTPKITGYDLGDNWGNTFRVEGGVLKVSYDRYAKFDNSHHLFHREKFSNTVSGSYRFMGGDAGRAGWAGTTAS